MPTNINQISLLLEVLRKLQPRQKLLLGVIFANTLVLAVIELFGLGAVIYFMRVVADPSQITESGILQYLYSTFTFEDDRSFLIFLGGGAIGSMVLRNAFSAYEIWFRLYFVSRLQIYFSGQLLSTYLHRSMLFFYENNSATLSRNILEEVSRFSNGFIMEVINVVTSGIVTLFIFTFIFINEPYFSIIAVGGLATLYLIVYFSFRNKTEQIGGVRLDANDERFKCVNEALGGIKETKLFSKENYYLNSFRDAGRRFFDATVIMQLLQSLPRFVFETIAFGGLVGFIILMLVSGEGVAAVIGSLTMFSLALYRAFPRMDTLLKGLLSLKFDKRVVMLIARSFDKQADDWSERLKNVDRLPFENSIKLDNVEFCYPNSKTPAARIPSLSIKAKTSIAFVGKTGAGKSTLVDLISGLISPTAGKVCVDNLAIGRNETRSWQENIGYVPQSIYLVDGTIASNIAFGADLADINMEQVIETAKIAHIHDFIVSELDNGYDTVVGERGVRLSGGQRQRIGIARALYKKPSLLILDEATSALDTVTESLVSQAIDDMAGKLTLIIIAHRLSSVKKCDRIIVLDQGEIVEEGAYEDLKSGGIFFKEMLEVNREGLDGDTA